MAFFSLFCSCFLLYVVANENDKYVTTESPATDATMAADALQTSYNADTPTTTRKPEQNLLKHAPAAGDQNLRPEKSLNVDNNDIILPNYKKIKKFPSEPDLKVLPYQTQEQVSSPSVVRSVKSDVKTSDEIIRSSDSVSEDLDNKNTRNNAENKNVYNSFAKNEINPTQPAIELSTEEREIPKQVPDVEQQFIKKQHEPEDDKADKTTE